MPRFQVVPPCGGHPVLLVDEVGMIWVSSRAPVWGHLISVDMRLGRVFVSSRAPVWGASYGGSEI